MLVSTHTRTTLRTRQLLDTVAASKLERVPRRGGALGARVSAQRTSALQLRHHAVQAGATPLLPHHSGRAPRVADRKALPIDHSSLQRISIGLINLELSSLLHVSQQHNFYFCGSSVPCDTTEQQTRAHER
jgi:hypothetical protein